MPEASPARRSAASSIAAIEKVHGPGDPRLPALRKQLGDTRALDKAQRGLVEAAHHSDPAFRAWAQLAAAAMPVAASAPAPAPELAAELRSLLPAPAADAPA